MRLSRRYAATAAAFGIALAGLVATQAPVEADKACTVRTNDSVRKVLNCVTLDGVLEHEQAFQDIADANGGIRSVGTPGYAASADYVDDRLTAAGYVVTRQTFEVFAWEDLGGSELEQIAPTPTAYVEGTDFAATTQTEPGDVTAHVTPVDIQLGLGNTSTSGCEASDFAGFPDGDIALIQRGFCTFEIKAENADAAGASGVLFFNQGNTTDPSRNGIPAVTLSNDYTGDIPALNLTYALGAELVRHPGPGDAALRRRQPGPLDHRERDRRVQGGRPEQRDHGGRTPRLRARGPGHQRQRLGLERADRGRRDAGQGEADEQAALRLVGRRGGRSGRLERSTWPTFSEEDAENIEMYLNFDMIGSPNYGLFIYDGDGSGFGLTGPDGSDEIEALFERYYAERDIPSEPTAFSGRSDYQAFINVGIPSGGLFTGAEGIKTPAQVEKWGGTAGVAYDPCYHSACDDIDNVSHEALAINADAVAYVVYLYSSGREVINAE